VVPLSGDQMKFGTNIVLIFILSGCLYSATSTKSARYGAIVGCVVDAVSGNFLSGVSVGIRGSNLSATTNRGKFGILNVFPGEYTVKASNPHFGPQTVFRIRVAPDSATYVLFRIHSNAIPEDPMPYTWEQTSTNIVPLTAESALNFSCQAR